MRAGTKQRVGAGGSHTRYKGSSIGQRGAHGAGGGGGARKQALPRAGARAARAGSPRPRRGAARRVGGAGGRGSDAAALEGEVGVEAGGQVLALGQEAVEGLDVGLGRVGLGDQRERES
jgi:hypothetical protein